MNPTISTMATNASITSVPGPNSLALVWQPQLAAPHRPFFLLDSDEMVGTSLIDRDRRRNAPSGKDRI
jgi:hypothetical protein